MRMICFVAVFIMIMMHNDMFDGDDNDNDGLRCECLENGC